MGAVGGQARTQIEGQLGTPPQLRKAGGKVNVPADERSDTSPQLPRQTVSVRPSLPPPKLNQVPPARKMSMPEVSQGVENRGFQRQRESNRK